MAEECTHNCSTCSANCSSKEKNSLMEQPNPLSSVKHIIAVVSGKGGVGKSLVTSMLAVNMQRLGYKTAILDADVTGPSIPKAFGLKAGVDGDEHGMIPPTTTSGIDIMSVNLMLDEETKPVAAGRLRFDGEEYTIDILCRRPEETDDYADFVLKMLIYQAVQHGANRITAFCPAAQETLFFRNRFQLVTQVEGICTMKLENAAVHHCCQ